MLFHFCTYGFLKNQRYFEPFIYLAFLDKGLNFFQIGLLIGLKEVTLNTLEVFSGILADVFSRRKLIQLSFLSYAVSFAVLAFVHQVFLLSFAMILYAIGDSFRTGTHKAMIFKWLQLNGKTDQKTKVYGYTRSWSKLGSAVSVILASGLLLYFDSYEPVFYFSMIPCLLGIANICFYPESLEEYKTPSQRPSIGQHISNTWNIMRERPVLRRLLVEAAGFEGVFLTIKDYLQPLLKTAAVLWLTGWLALPISDTRAATLLVGPVYFVLFIGSAVASRLTHVFVRQYGNEEKASRALWVMAVWIYAGMLFGFIYLPVMALSLFVFLHILLNLWRPTIISRFDDYGASTQGATLLSMESQARRFTVMLMAPILGWIIDFSGGKDNMHALWPLALFGLVVCLIFVLSTRELDQAEPQIKAI
ncbi:MAG: hypothetical protein CR997_01420 [Acidobacteria bacterium]|nr:MAG: hypothetical protein CR997_01420 [Acidobacteriota bacterium]